jgi:ribonuclease P protein component
MANTTPQTFQPSARVRAAPEYQAVFKSGLKRTGVFFRLYFLAATGSSRSRLGLAVPKKAAALAVTRNRIKRVSREAFRCLHGLPPGDYVLVAQAKAATAENSALRSELQRLFSSI